MKAGPIYVVKLSIPGLVLVLAILCSPYSHASVEKVVYHLHHTQPNSLKRAVNNLENLKRGMLGRSMDIRLLLQGNSIQLLYPSQQDKKLMSRLLKLSDGGLNIEVSRENFRKNGHLIEPGLQPRVFDNIFSRIIDLQQQGYRYLTP